ncbi:MAG: TetR/AcrR family transcriptional regulator [Acidimicrobiales bacterium]
MTDSPRDRIMDAVLVCVDRGGLRSFALEDVAAEAGFSRATIYRHFPGGRTQLINDTVTREVGAFWGELADFVRPYGAIEDRLVIGLMEARRRIDGNDLLQRLVASEPDDFLPTLAESDQLVHLVLVGYLRDLILREELVEGLDVDVAAEYLARMLLSHIGTAGRWDLTDRAQVERLVRTQFLAGVIRPKV